MLSNFNFSEPKNIVRFAKFVDDEKPEWVFGSVCFLIMEHCSSGSLVDRIDKMKAAGPTTRALEAGVIEAKIYLDLKPTNVFMMEDYIEVSFFNETKLKCIQIKLGDFGSAATMSSVVLPWLHE